MAIKRVLSGVSVLILTTVACIGGAGSPNIQETVDAAVQSTQDALGENGAVETPNSPVSSPFATTSTLSIQDTSQVDESEPCGANKWRLFAVSKHEQPSSAGLKTVFVQIAIQNGSSKPGQLIHDFPTATTEGGFTYPAILKSVARGAVVSVVPGLTISGGLPLSNNLFQPLIWSFEVAETQKSLSITFPGAGVGCYGSTGEIVTEMYDSAPLVVEVDEDLSKPFDFAAQLEKLRSVEEGIEMMNLGRLEFISATREPLDNSTDEVLTLRFNFTNGSAGYQVSGSMKSYVLDSAGAVHNEYYEVGRAASDSGKYEAGPAQTTEVEFKYYLSNPADKLAIVIEFASTTGLAPSIPIYVAYALP